ncbi:MAG: hypothetical protein R6X06_01640 [Gammaproteobacteria bacterium]
MYNASHSGNGKPETAEVARVTDRVFHQRHQATGVEQVFEIFNKKYLKIDRRHLLGNKSYQLNLSLLEPWPAQQRYVSWRWLLSTVYFAITTLVFGAYLYHQGSPEHLGRLMPFVFIFLLMTLASLLMFFLRSPHVTVFRSRYCGTTLVSLFQNNPDAEAFRAFVEELKNRILMASQSVKADKHKMLLFEFKTLRRLMNEGVIPATELDKARSRIPNMKAMIQ